MKIPEIPITTDDLLLGALWPALVATAVAAAAALLPLRRREWVAPLAVALGFATAYPMINGIAARFWPNSAGDWLFWLSIPIAIASGFIAMWTGRPAGRTLLGTVVIAAVLYLMMQPAAASRSGGEWWSLFAVIVLILAVDLWFIDSSLTHDRSAASMLGFLGILFGACVLIHMSGSLKWSMQAGAATAACAAVFLLAILGMHRATLIPAVAPTAVAIVGLLFAVSIEPLFVNVRVSNALLIAAAPPLLWLGRFIQFRRAPEWVNFSIRLALPAIPVLIALGIAGAKALADLNDPGSGYEGY